MRPLGVIPHDHRLRLGQRAFEHTVVPGDVAFVHGIPSFLNTVFQLCRRAMKPEMAATAWACCSSAEMVAGRSPS